MVRLSGDGVRGVLGKLGVEPAVFTRPGSARLVRLVDPEDGSVLDHGVVVYNAGPSSYTGEDVAEVSVHGGLIGPGLVVEACLRAGAREAEPGEFTRRRWAAGKMDALQVEGLSVLLDAESRGARKLALGRLEGGLSRRIQALRGILLDVEALLAHHLDFPDEDEPPTPAGAIGDRLDEVAQALAELRATAPVARRLQEGAIVVLAGRPNAGKSSLFNAWLGEERVLVSPEPGTTRDAVEVGAFVGDVPVRLFDTAGLRDEAGALEAAGIEMAERWLKSADAVIWLHRAEWGPPGKEEIEAMLLRVSRGNPGCLVLPVMSCADAHGQEGGVAGLGSGAREWRAWRPVAGEDWVALSVREGRGLHGVLNRLGALLGVGGGAPGGVWSEGTMLVREDEVRRVRGAEEAVDRAATLLREGLGAELAACEVREAGEALSGLIGEIAPEEVLDRLFSRFCIGK